ncbi:hypothetical protein ACFOD0_03020 [Shewanella intestini]|uniref:DUF945 family protein n=1 Tax=Shewanella intestini TaxID=2017544 RepID=A0ABS5I260_9GAMM|nr:MULTISPECIES: hypothetical protein [Shewanella]MBR9727971.1 hypothetical protein [Shewanella intestini]MRG36478.1 hypothetical protein [Shewanella sp. XMDDZSB0408]
MNKFFVSAGLVTVAAAGYVAMNESSQVAADSILANVPADTVFFSGQLKPFPIKNYLLSTSKNYQQQDAKPLPLEKDSPLLIEPFTISLLNHVMSLAHQPEKLLASFGLADEMKSYAYFIGALPVVKIEVADAKAFWGQIDNAEAQSGVKHQQGELDGQAFRSYAIIAPQQGQSFDLVIAEHNGWFTFTVKTSLIDDEFTAQALGARKVTHPITETSLLTDIFKRHGFVKDALSFFNHKALVAGLTTQDGNTLAKQLAKLEQWQNNQDVQLLQTPVCHQELTSISDNWPMTVMGFNQLDISANYSKIGNQLVVESKNAPILAALNKLRGFVPSIDENSNLFSFALGSDVGKLSSSLSAIWTELQAPSYQCAPLAELQQELTSQNPMMLGMMTSMADGVKGVSVAVNGYQLSEQHGEPKVDNLDAVVAISAEDPHALLSLAAPLYPPLAQLNLTADSAPVDVSSLLMLPPEYGIKAKLAIKGQHLVLFSGDKGEAMANALGKQKLSTNGLVSTHVDYVKALSPLFDFIEQSGESIPPELKMFEGNNIKIGADFDINSQGLILSTQMTYGDKN